MAMMNVFTPLRKTVCVAIVGMASWGVAVSNAQAQTAAVPVPSAGLMPNPAKGKALFVQKCASCHGVDLKGRDTGADRGPPFLHRVYEPSHHGDAAFQSAVANGVRAHHWKFGNMPAVKGLTPDDVAHITAYIRMEQRKVGIN
jgi:mono/diheme cytochrome c family protein